jgi:HSP20 family protein
MATVVRWEPFRELTSLHNQMNRLLNAFEGNGGREAAPTTWAPAVDVWETESELVYAFDLPGVDKDRISLEVEDGLLTVGAERERSEKVESERFYRFERRFGSFTRSIGLPQGVSEDQITAGYADGVLEVHVPKPETAKPRRIEIGGSGPATIEGDAQHA